MAFFQSLEPVRGSSGGRGVHSLPTPFWLHVLANRRPLRPTEAYIPRWAQHVYLFTVFAVRVHSCLSSLVDAWLPRQALWLQLALWPFLFVSHPLSSNSSLRTACKLGHVSNEVCHRARAASGLRAPMRGGQRMHDDGHSREPDAGSDRHASWIRVFQASLCAGRQF